LSPQASRVPASLSPRRPARGPRAARLRRPRGVRGFVEAAGPDWLSGWAVGEGVLRFEARVGPDWIPVHVEREPRADVEGALAAAGPCSGFRLIALDCPAPWHDVPPERVSVRVNGVALAWVGNPRRDARTACRGDLGLRVPDAPPAVAEPGGATTEAERAESRFRALHWELLRRLNAAVDSGTPLGPALAALRRDADAPAEVLARLGESVRPLMYLEGGRAGRAVDSPAPVPCRHPGGLARLRALRDPWQASLLLAELADAGELRLATAVAWRLGTLTERPDWLSTACLRHAAARVLRTHARAGPEPAPRLFLHALLRLVRVQSARWFSRLHDEHLVAAFVLALAHVLGAGDPELRRCHLREVRRSFWLNPVFWRHAARAGLTAHPDLQADFAAWRCLAEGFAAPRPGAAAWREGVDAALSSMLAAGCVDAAQVQRELRAADALGVPGAPPARLLPTYAISGREADAARLGYLAGRLPAGEGPLVVCVVRNEIALLPHFLAHYRRLGAAGFLFVDNGSDDGTREALLAQTDALVYAAEGAYRDAHYGVAWQQALLGNLCHGRWVLVVDADEFLVYDDCERRALPGLLAAVEAAGADAVFTDLVDMYPGGRLEEADLLRRAPFEAAPYFDERPLRRWWLGSGRFSNAPSLVSALRHRLAPDAEPNAFTSQKCALFRYRPWLRLAQGLHDVAGLVPYPQRFWLAHFKYHAQFGQRVQAEIERMQHFDGAREYRHYARMLREREGGFMQPGLSVRYTGSADFRRHAAVAATAPADE
jgi:hypothetical protein